MKWDDMELHEVKAMCFRCGCDARGATEDDEPICEACAKGWPHSSECPCCKCELERGG